MKRKPLFWGTGAMILVAAAAITTVVLLLWHEPDVYRQAALPPGPQRQQQSSQFQTEFFHLINNQVLGNEPKWGAEFTQEQINSYLQEDFLQPGTADKILPAGISDLRVQMDPNKLRVAFRYGRGIWSTIVSVDMNVWVAGKEANALVIEIQRLRAGALPISAQSLLERFAEAARAQRMDVTWYRHQGNPAAVLRFSTDQPRAAGRLQSLEVQQGKLAISGCTVAGP